MKAVLALSFIGCALATLFSSQLSYYLFGSSNYSYFIILILIYTFFYNIITLFKSTFQSLYLFGRMAIVTLVFIITTRATAIGLALLSMGLEGVLIGYILGSLTAFLTSIALLRGKLLNTNKNDSLKLLLKFSLPLFVTSLTLLILNWADVLIVTMITSNYALTGVYYIALNSVTALSILWIPIITTPYSQHFQLKMVSKKHRF